MGYNNYRVKNALEDMVTIVENEVRILSENMNNEKFNLEAKIRRLSGLLFDIEDKVQEFISISSDANRVENFNEIETLFIRPTKALLAAESMPIAAIIPSLAGLASQLRELLSRTYSLYVKYEYLYIVGGSIQTEWDHSITSEARIKQLYADLGADISTTVLSKLKELVGRPLKVFFHDVQYDYYMIENIKNDEGYELYGSYNSNFDIDVTARSYFKGVAVGPQSSIISSNKVFDIGVTRLLGDDKPYLNELGTANIPNEVSTLERVFRYVKNGGYVLAQIPYFALTRQVCTAIAKGSTVKLAGLSCSEPRILYMILSPTVDISKEQAHATFRYLRGLFHIDGNMPSVIKPEDIDVSDFSLEQTKDIKMFRGACPDIMAMLIALERSTAYTSNKKNLLDHMRPPQPLSKGQIGHALASGLIDGVIDEGNGMKFAIRARTYPLKVTDREPLPGEGSNGFEDRLITRTINNHAIDINTFDGEGNYKSIALA